MVLRLDGGLFFATSDALEDRVRELIHSTPDITGMVLDCEGIDYIDSQGSAKLGEIVNLTQQSGITLRLARVKPAVSTTLGKDGILRPDRNRQDPRERSPSRQRPTRRPAATDREHIAGIAASSDWAAVTNRQRDRDPHALTAFRVGPDVVDHHVDGERRGHRRH